MRAELEEVKEDNNEAKRQIAKSEDSLNSRKGRKETENTTDNMREELEQIKQRVCGVESKIDKMTEKWDRFKKEFEENMSKKMEKMFDEWEEKERKKKFYNNQHVRKWRGR